MTDKLTEAHSPLPCPFCGVNVKTVSAHPGLYFGHADDCYLSAALIHLPTSSHGAWNTRSPSHAALLAENERLRKALGMIARAHVPDQPSAMDIPEAAFVRRHVAWLRQTAREALTPAADAAGG